MGNPAVVAAQMAAHGDEVARLRADLHAARADAAEQSRLRVEAETAAVEARGERGRLADQIRRTERAKAAIEDATLKVQDECRLAIESRNALAARVAELETAVVDAALEAQAEQERLAARVRELEYTLAACKNLGAAADSAAVALLRRADEADGEHQQGCPAEGEPTPGVRGECNCWLAAARAFLEESRG